MIFSAFDDEIGVERSNRRFLSYSPRAGNIENTVENRRCAPSKIPRLGIRSVLIEQDTAVRSTGGSRSEINISVPVNEKALLPEADKS